jgi:hypothetical protein
MPRTPELTLELASMRSEWHELDRACGELPEGSHIHGLLQVAMTRLDDRIKVLERTAALLSAGQSSRLGAALSLGTAA